LNPGPFIHGPVICYSYLKDEEILNGRTGRVMFNDNGDRINAVYQVVNVRPEAEVKVIGKYDPFKSSVSLQRGIRVTFHYSLEDKIAPKL
jgi:hypothetical protein